MIIFTNRLPKTVSFSALIHLYSRERNLVLILKEVKKTDRSPYSFRKKNEDSIYLFRKLQP